MAEVAGTAEVAEEVVAVGTAEVAEEVVAEATAGAADSVVVATFEAEAAEAGAMSAAADTVVVATSEAAAGLLGRGNRRRPARSIPPLHRGTATTFATMRIRLAGTGIN